jgi:hypothetical protein
LEKKWYNFFVVTSPTRQGEEPAPAAPPARAIDIVAEPDPVPEPQLDSAAGPVAFEEIYQSAQIGAPAHGYTVLKVADMLRSEHIRALPPDVKSKSIMVALEAAGVDISDIVQDAVRRDRALDAYERVLVKNLETLRAEKENENRRLEEEINRKLAELRSRMEGNTKAVAAEEEQLLAWRSRKVQEEEMIAEAVGYFVSENPITTAGGPSEKK